MKVREEPVTLWTIEMLPASRLESCARNSVGRSSVVSFSLSSTPRSVRLAEAARIDVSTASSRSPPAAATTMSMVEQSASSPFMRASSSARPGGIGAEPLPGFHLALVAALGDLQAPVDLRKRMDAVGRETLAESTTGCG